MSNTKGSMLISNANAVGTELVNQLGGTGYKPSEWSDAINLLGISDDDKASALASITEGTYTGNERGAIKYSNCNAVGAMLNKKFSTNRGFKPVEWESAISKLTPLAEGTVSGSICNIVNGADQVPLKNWLVTLPASLSGYSSVTAYQAKKNLFDGWEKGYGINSTTGAIVTTTAGAISGYVPVKENADYYVSGLTSTLLSFFAFYKEDKTFISRTNGNDKTGASFTAPSECAYVILYQYIVSSSTGTLDDLDNLQTQIEVGNTATAYEAYEAPTQYTASLGRTIYGGTADIVTGEGSNGSILIDLSELTWNMDNDTRFRSRQTDYTGASGWSGNWQNTVSNRFVCENPATAFTNRSDYSFANIPQNYYNFDIKVPTGIFQDATEFKTWLGNIDGNDTHAVVVIDRLSAETFTFTPITPTPETPLGVSNWWSEQGDSSITYRKDPDIPDPPVQLLNMNNNNTEENNNEGV